MTADETIIVVMRIADEAKEQVEYHTREAAKYLKQAEALGEVVAALMQLKQSG